jgi:predicted helicase
MTLHNIYIKTNKDWDYEHKVKYGYVYGSKKNLINRLKNSCEEHSEHSSFLHIFSFTKNSKYININYKEIDKIISITSISTNKINNIERIYKTKFILLRKLNKYLIISKSKTSNEFLNKDGIDLFINIMKTEFILLGLELVSEYSNIELNEINNEAFKFHPTKIEPFSEEKYLDYNKENIIIKHEYQLNIIEKIETFYNNNNIGQLIWACGLGKTLMSLFIVQELLSKHIIFNTNNTNNNTNNTNNNTNNITNNITNNNTNNTNNITNNNTNNTNNKICLETEEEREEKEAEIEEEGELVSYKLNTIQAPLILIGVPSINLQEQFKEEIYKLFPNENNIILSSYHSKKILKLLDKDEYNTCFFEKNDSINIKEPVFIISTYHSLYKFINIKFDFKIGDEAHHLVGVSIEKEKEELKKFTLFHKIKSTKTLFMTATPKIIDYKNILSMDDKNIFGEIIDEKTFHWAIENKKITDYNILLLNNNEEDIDHIIHKLNIEVKNKELFISCFMTLKCMSTFKNITHTLLYTNNIEESQITTLYIKKLLDYNDKFFSKTNETNETKIFKLFNIRKKNIYNNNLNSKSKENLNNELEIFSNKKYGIISCVYMFGEGFNLPILDSVCIASAMYSDIRIVQYLMRANRLNKHKINKIAFYIIPIIINTINNNNHNNSNSKFHIKINKIIYSLRNIDESIISKIIIPYGGKKKKNPTKEYYLDYNFEHNQQELVKLEMKLIYSKDIPCLISEEQKEYNYVKSINACLNILTLEDYNDKKLEHEHYIENPKTYFKNKGVWKNWYDFCGCDLTKMIDTKFKWLLFCKEKNIESLEDYYKLCEKYNNLPKYPEELYDNFSNIKNELELNSFKRR